MDLCVVGEQLVASGLLFVGEQVGAEERPAGDVRRVAGASPVTAGVLLDAPPALVEGFTGQPNDMDGVHHRNRGGELFAGGGLLAGEPGYRDDLHRVAPRLRAVGEPGLEGLLGAVPTPGRPRRPTGQRRTQSPYTLECEEPLCRIVHHQRYGPAPAPRAAAGPDPPPAPTRALRRHRRASRLRSPPRRTEHRVGRGPPFTWEVLLDRRQLHLQQILSWPIRSTFQLNDTSKFTGRDESPGRSKSAQTTSSSR